MSIKKAKLSKNALSHGLYAAADAVLPWENENQFSDLHQALRQDLGPEGPFEEDEVWQITRLKWIQRRLNVGSQFAYQRDPDVNALSVAAQEGPDGIVKYFQEINAGGDNVRDSMRAVAKSHAQAMMTGMDRVTNLLSPSSTTAVDSNAIEKLNASVKQLSLVSSNIVATLKELENFDIEERVCDRAYRPDIIEKNLQVNAQIDRSIDKHMVRLVNLKEFKRQYAKKEVKQSSMKLIEPAPAKSIASKPN
jgi:hypothetical protein